MFQRILSLPENQSFFLFGPRGTGKSTLLRQHFGEPLAAQGSETALYIDLLDPEQEDAFLRNPKELERRLDALPSSVRWIILDEVQKAPRLLDSVHRAIETRSLCFALTGSSARKLKRGGANLLAGRAFVYPLYSLTHLEIGSAFDLDEALHFGTLPKIVGMKTREEKSEFLRAYAHTYIKEEIVAEQLVRKLQPFRDFLEIAAQCNGQILNFTRVAKEVGADVKTIQSYFEILEDTLVGFLLAPFHESIRKRQRQSPKFYFFDTGVKRALDRTLTQSFGPGTYAYGNAFEHFIILEIHRLSTYERKDWRLSYLRTKDDAEIDLVIERPGMPRALVEIKSKDRITEADTVHLNRLAPDIQESEAYCLSRDPVKKRIGSTLCLPWQEGLRDLGLGLREVY